MNKINLLGFDIADTKIDLPDINLSNKLICYAALNIFSTIFSSYMVISSYRTMYPEILTPIIIITPLLLGLLFISYKKGNRMFTFIFMICILIIWVLTYAELDKLDYHTNPIPFFKGLFAIIVINVSLWYIISLIQDKIISKYLDRKTN